MKKIFFFNVSVSAGRAATGQRGREVGALEQSGLRLGRGQRAGRDCWSDRGAVERPQEALVHSRSGRGLGRTPGVRGQRAAHERRRGQGRDEPADPGRGRRPRPRERAAEEAPAQEPHNHPDRGANHTT